MKIWYENKEIEVERIYSKMMSYKKGKRSFSVVFFAETKTERFPVITFLIKWDKSGNRVCTVVDKSIEK